MNFSYLIEKTNLNYIYQMSHGRTNLLKVLLVYLLFRCRASFYLQSYKLNCKQNEMFEC